MKPAFYVFLLACEYDALPGDLPGPLVILAHQVRVFIKHLNRAIVLGPFELEAGKVDLSFHLPVYQPAPNSGVTTGFELPCDVRVPVYVKETVLPVRGGCSCDNVPG